MSETRLYINVDRHSPTVARLLDIISKNAITDDCGRAVLIGQTYSEINRINLENADFITCIDLLTIYTHLIIRFISATTDGVSKTTVPALWLENWCMLVRHVEQAIGRSVRWCELLFIFNTIIHRVDGRPQLAVKQMDTIVLTNGDENERQFVKTIAWLEAIYLSGAPPVRPAAPVSDDGAVVDTPMPRPGVDISPYLKRPEVEHSLVHENRERYYIEHVDMFSRINSPMIADILPRISVSFFAPELNEMFGIEGETLRQTL